MNEIEKQFYVAFGDYEYEIENIIADGKEAENEMPIPDKPLEPGIVISPYKADFVYGDCVIEIDGHESHKTKEQRDHDYKRERYLQCKGYTVIRFTGTEVFLDARKCVIDMVTISNLFEQKTIDAFLDGQKNK